MSEKQLLLPSANVAVVYERQRPREYAYYFLVVVGVAMVLVGAASLLSAAAHTVLGKESALVSFGPVGLLPLAAPSAPATTTPLIPTTLVIPSLHIEATVESVGKKADGAMAAPTRFDTVGWWRLGSAPGESGNAVMAGHVNNARTTAGVFAHLADIRIGEQIEVSAEGRTLVYVVEEVSVYGTDDAPLTAIFRADGPSGLVLITCEGDWQPAVRSFDKRLVVYSRFLGEK